MLASFNFGGLLGILIIYFWIMIGVLDLIATAIVRYFFGNIYFRLEGKFKALRYYATTIIVLGLFLIVLVESDLKNRDLLLFDEITIWLSVVYTGVLIWLLFFYRGGSSR